MVDVAVLGGGLAGLSAAAALGSCGLQVRLLEQRPFLGGRATSFPLNSPAGPAEVIDNCQHVLLRCCVNLLDFYSRLGVRDQLQFHDRFYFVEPGGRVSELSAGVLPAPLHFTGSFLAMKCLSLQDKLAISRALLAIRTEHSSRKDLDRITMLDWLREKKQTPQAIERFWRQILVSAINEDLERMAACHGFQVFWLGFLSNAQSYQMGVPAVPLGDLYSPERWSNVGDISLEMRHPVERICIRDGMVQEVRAGGQSVQARFYVSALPLDRLIQIAPDAGLDASWLEHSPITGVHLWFDREITALPHATLLDRTMQWMFNKREGRYLQLVVSASRSLLRMEKGDIVDLALRDLADFFPAVRDAKLERAQVVKEVKATFSAKPGLEGLRPGPRGPVRNLFFAGDWTRSGWPATMEGAVRSGYKAAECAAYDAGYPLSFVLPDVA